MKDLYEEFYCCNNLGSKSIGFHKNNLNDYENRLLKLKFHNSSINKENSEEINNYNFEKSFEDNLNIAEILDESGSAQNILNELNEEAVKEDESKANKILKRQNVIIDEVSLEDSHDHNNLNQSNLNKIIQIQRYYRKYIKNKSLKEKEESNYEKEAFLSSIDDVEY
jgi:hypothetical protein